MSTPHNTQELGKPSRSKKKRSAVFIVIAASVAVHVLGLAGLAAIKIIEVLQPEPEFEAPPVVAVKPPPPPPPPPPTSKRAQRSMPRPQPLAVQNAQNMSAPVIEINNSNLTIGGGRGFGGGLGQLGGAVADSIRITSFGFDRAMEGTLEGTLYDLKQDPDGKPTKQAANSSVGRPTKEAHQATIDVINRYTRSWSEAFMERSFFQAEKKLYASYFVIPFQPAKGAPKAFNAENQIKPSRIAAIYKGSFTPTKSGRFRFYGRGDDVLIVRLNRRIVLDGSWDLNTYSNEKVDTKNKNNFGQSLFNFREDHPGVYGDWFDLREGASMEFEIVLSEVPGGAFGAWLMIEEKGDSAGPKIFSSRPLSKQDRDYLLKLHPDSKRFLP